MKPAVGLGRRSRIEEGERLLAIVHGFGPTGFRNPEARQAYLLKNAAGSKLRVVREEETGEPPANETRRRDLLSGEVDGVERILYWTGARYALGR